MKSYEPAELVNDLSRFIVIGTCNATERPCSAHALHMLMVHEPPQFHGWFASDAVSRAPNGDPMRSMKKRGLQGGEKPPHPQIVSEMIRVSDGQMQPRSLSDCQCGTTFGAPKAAKRPAEPGRFHGFHVLSAPW